MNARENRERIEAERNREKMAGPAHTSSEHIKQGLSDSVSVQFSKRMVGKISYDRGKLETKRFVPET